MNHTGVRVCVCMCLESLYTYLGYIGSIVFSRRWHRCSVVVLGSSHGAKLGLVLESFFFLSVFCFGYTILWLLACVVPEPQGWRGNMDNSRLSMCREMRN